MLIPVIEIARREYNLDNCEDRYKNVDSTKNTIKEFKTYTGTLTAGVANYNPHIDIFHYLGFKPLIEGYMKLSTETIWRPIPYAYRWIISSVYHKIEVGMKQLDTDSIRIQLRTDDRLAVGESVSIDYKVIVNLVSDTDAWY